MCGTKCTAVPHFQVLDKICVETHRKTSFVLELAVSKSLGELQATCETGDRPITAGVYSQVDIQLFLSSLASSPDMQNDFAHGHDDIGLPRFDVASLVIRPEFRSHF
jgi:hypothetical protein